MIALRGLLLVAEDGIVGTLADVYFHGTLWLVRSLVVTTQGPARRVLIPVSSVQRCRFHASVIRMGVCLQDFYLLGRTTDLCARSARSLAGYAIEATDGPAGRVEDVIVDDAGWWIPHFVVNTRGLLPGDQHLAPSSAIAAIDSVHRKVRFRLRRAQIAGLPAPSDASLSSA